jgi:hypothetical protein
MFYSVFEKKEMFVQNVKLRYFIVLCDTNEYNVMGQDSGSGELYDVHNKTNISKQHWLGLHFCYDTTNIWFK